MRDNKKKKEQRERRTHHPGVWRKRVAHNIGITRHDMLSSKAIRAVSVDCPKQMWRINWLTGNKLILLHFSTIRSHDKQGKGKGKKKKRLSIYLSSKGRHKAGDAEFLIVQSIKETPSVGMPLLHYCTQHRS